MQIPFTKMHGLGNDFIVLDGVSHDIVLTPEKIRQLSDRHFGIGFDQLLLVEPPSDPSVDFDYRIFNGDGEEVEHCGNGARCFANFVHDRGLTHANPVRVRTINRVLSLQRQADGMVSVDMGRPEFEPEKIPFRAPRQETLYQRKVVVAGESRQLSFAALSMGNPHAVLIVEDLDSLAVKDIGEALGSHPDFPAGVNVGFMELLSRDEIKLRVYERGAGETLACGTGACAAMVAGCLQGVIGDTVKVNLRGGQLDLQWQGQDSAVIMTGPTATVYEGSFTL